MKAAFFTIALLSGAILREIYREHIINPYEI